MRSSTILLLSAGFRFLLIRSKSDIKVETLKYKNILIFERKFNAELAFCQDIPYHEKNPESRGLRSRITGIQIPKLKKIPNLGDSPKIRDFPIKVFGIFHSAFFRDFQIQIPIPVILGFAKFFFRDFNIPISIRKISGFLRFLTRDFGIFEIFHSGFRGFFALAQNKKSLV